MNEILVHTIFIKILTPTISNSLHAACGIMHNVTRAAHYVHYRIFLKNHVLMEFFRPIFTKTDSKKVLPKKFFVESVLHFAKTVDNKDLQVLRNWQETVA